ncbi:MAG: glycoside hydrolase family 15 protein [Actinobacteria bacterium]|nr:glycoside hydrolase family 15 protein [Actinomycetota bacterium]
MKISDYAFLSDCQSAALVSRDGSIDWYCVPRFDSPTVLGRLLDPNAGHWRLCPADEYQAERSYVKETLVLKNVYTTDSGSVEVVEALVLDSRSGGDDIGKEVPHLLVRNVRGLEGSVEMEMAFRPRFEYGLTHPHFRKAEKGYIIVGGPVELELSAPVEIELAEGDAVARFSVAAGETAGFSLVFRAGFREEPMPPPDVKKVIEETVAAWESWTAAHDKFEGLYAEAVKRSALVLQGLTFMPSGSLVAAATTSLPEVMGGDANWDYRFTWLRDASMTMRALWVTSCPDKPERFFDWISRASGRFGLEAVQIMYGVEGERDLTEHALSHLSGFAGSKPVRIGNDAWKQKQLDVLGEVLNAAYILRERLGELDDWDRELLIIFADRAASSWQEPDAGIWEARDRERHYTLSKVMCWVALDRAVKLAVLLKADREQRQRWARAREEVRAAVIERAWHPEVGAYTGAFGSDRLDAALLLLPLVEFLPATDMRMRATIMAIEREFCQNGLVRRWQEEKNGFIICSYWLVECLALMGDVERAREIFEQVTALANDLGLMSEMADPDSGELLGNFPQAFSHVGLINAAWRLTMSAGDRDKEKTG